MMRAVDVLIVGAGISGIGLAVHLLKKVPSKSIAIIEARDSIGGTWDFFKYPGIRSDSDMSTFGYAFKPWMKTKTLADAQSIKTYLEEVLEEYNLYKNIYLKSRVIQANFDSKTKFWHVEIKKSNGQIEMWTTQFLMGCTGYYNYEQPYMPIFKGQTEFKGQLIHPQHWPEGLDYSNKNLVVIGSGATAITLVPALVKGGAKHVIMLQRSPTYIVSVSALDQLYMQLRKLIPISKAYKLIRARNIVIQRFIYLIAKKQPELVRKLLLALVKKELQQKVDMRHFTPTYKPWEQRLCVVPDGDFFQVLREGQASVVTDHLDRFTENGILLQSGEELKADIIVSATGLNLQILGGLTLTIDHEKIDTAQHMLYQGTMLNNVPNFFILMGYINASWTLKVDIVSDYIARLLGYMDQHALETVFAQGDVSAFQNDTIMGDLSAGYIARAVDIMPKQGKYAPWQITHNYLADRKALKHANFNDQVLQFNKI